MNTLEQNITDMVCEVGDYIFETHKIFAKNTPLTHLEYMLYDEFSPFLKFYMKRVGELMEQTTKRIEERKKEERKKTRKCKRKRSKLRETMKKKGHTWVKGKGAVKTKEVYSHPKHKYGLRSIQRVLRSHKHSR